MFNVYVGVTGCEVITSESSSGEGDYTADITARQWIAEHLGDPRRKYRPPPGRDLRRTMLRWTPKHIAGRYYQLLLGHAAIGPYLKDRIHEVEDDRC